MSPFGSGQTPAVAPETVAASGADEVADPKHDGFVAKGRSKIEEIDALLKGEDK